MAGRHAIALCLFWPLLVFAKNPCSREEAERAEKAVDGLNSWDLIHDWYENYRQCDDGGPAELVSEAVARNLVDRWETLPHLNKLAKDARFRQFVLKHIDETLNADDVKKIGLNAEKRCPTNLRPLCRDLKTRAEAP